MCIFQYASRSICKTALSLTPPQAFLRLSEEHGLLKRGAGDEEERVEGRMETSEEREQ